MMSLIRLPLRARLHATTLAHRLHGLHTGNHCQTVGYARKGAAKICGCWCQAQHNAGLYSRPHTVLLGERRAQRLIWHKPDPLNPWGKSIASTRRATIAPGGSNMPGVATPQSGGALQQPSAPCQIMNQQNSDISKITFAWRRTLFLLVVPGGTMLFQTLSIRPNTLPVCYPMRYAGFRNPKIRSPYLHRVF